MISGAIENTAGIAAEKSGGCSYTAKWSLAALAGIQSHRGGWGPVDDGSFQERYYPAAFMGRRRRCCRPSATKR